MDTRDFDKKENIDEFDFSLEDILLEFGSGRLDIEESENYKAHPSPVPREAPAFSQSVDQSQTKNVELPSDESKAKIISKESTEAGMQDNVEKNISEDINENSEAVTESPVTSDMDMLSQESVKPWQTSANFDLDQIINEVKSGDSTADLPQEFLDEPASTTTSTVVSTEETTAQPENNMKQDIVSFVTSFASKFKKSKNDDSGKANIDNNKSKETVSTEYVNMDPILLEDEETDVKEYKPHTEDNAATAESSDTVSEAQETVVMSAIKDEDVKLYNDSLNASGSSDFADESAAADNTSDEETIDDSFKFIYENKDSDHVESGELSSEDDAGETDSAFKYYKNKVKSFASQLNKKKNVDREDKDNSLNEKSKGSFLTQYLAVLSLKIQQAKENAKSAPAEEAEDLGPELSADKAAKYYGSYVKFMKHRLHIAMILSFILFYISSGLPVPGRLHNITVLSLACLVIELSVIVTCVDQFTGGILDLIRKKITANSLVSISCILSIIDAIIIASTGNKEIGLPYCAVSAATLTCTLWAAVIHCRGNRITFKALSLVKKPYAITAETGIGGYDDITLIKTKSSTDDFVRRTEERALDEEIYSLLAPVLICLSLLLCLIAMIVSKDFIDFVHILSAIFISAAPFCILLSFPLPFLYTSKKLFHDGTAIAGWSGLCDIGESKHIIITDNDIFPKNTISIDSIRVLEGVSPQKIITYAGSVIVASGSALAPAFSDLLNKNACVIEPVTEFKCHEGGGLTAMINGDEVLCGNAGFMHLMGIRIPQKLASKSSVFVAVNGMISAIFIVKYTPVVSVQRALLTLMRSRRINIFAVRDFNITPEMIRHKFKMPSDRFDFPSFAERYAISNATRSDDSKISAIVARDGITHMVRLTDEGHRLYNVVRLSVFLCVLSTIIGMIMAFIMCLSGAFESISVCNMFIYFFVWFLVEWVVVIIQNR